MGADGAPTRGKVCEVGCRGLRDGHLRGGEGERKKPRRTLQDGGLSILGIQQG